MRFKNLVSSKLLSIVTWLDVDFNCHFRIGLHLGQVGTDSDPGWAQDSGQWPQPEVLSVGVSGCSSALALLTTSHQTSQV